ncbi:MAG: 2Fe-2S ferredoxin [Pseudohongiellaceae bacterium]|jgi:2Fe-2S ferredoxin
MLPRFFASFFAWSHQAVGGINPYISSVKADLPKAPYPITFVLGDEEKLVEVDPAQLPYTDEGLPGSILEIALGHGIEIDHACGGVVACSTCHVHVDLGGKSCNEAAEAEDDMLDEAPGVSPNSRLACQCIANGKEPLRVVVPGWNRNAVSEAPH